MLIMNTTNNRLLKKAILDLFQQRANPTALLRLMQLVSPMLPVGAYSYSQGLEWAVQSGWVHDEASAAEWMQGLMTHNLGQLDVPVLARLHQAWRRHDREAVGYWSALLHASRESAELQNEDRQLGWALARVLNELEIGEAQHWLPHPAANFANMFALAAAVWNISLEETCLGYLWAWSENQTSAAMKLIPLGQSAGQRLLSRAIETIPAIVQSSLRVSDDEIGAFIPGLALASARHETQYTRLFRS